MIRVKSIFAENELRNFSYLVYDDQSGHAWVIDPFDAKPFIDFVRKSGLELKGILNTHQHWDHIRGNRELQSVFHCEVCQCTDQSEIELGEGHRLRTLGTPGHTHDHKAFQWCDKNGSLALFSGDTLFNSGVGNCKNGGNVGELYETTMELMKLPDETVLYPGHDYMLRNLAFAQECDPENKAVEEALRVVKDMNTETNLGWTLGQEKQVNPFLRLYSESLRRNILNTVEQLPGLERNLFVRLRELRDKW